MTGSVGIRVTVLVGAVGDAAQISVLPSEATPLKTLLDERGGSAQLSVISTGSSRSFSRAHVHLRPLATDRSATDRALKSLGIFWLRDRLEAHPLGRLLNSLGPVAPSRVFWRALKMHPRAMDLLRESDVVIASDLETTKAAWIAVRRGWVRDAFYDQRALALLADGQPSPLPGSG